jgi:hypothetical protein
MQATITKEQHEMRDALQRDIGAYVSDLAVALERLTRGAIEDESGSLIHAVALRIYDLAGASMVLADATDSAAAERAYREAHDLFEGPDAARARLRSSRGA